MKKRILAFILALVLIGNINVCAYEPFADVKEADYFYVSVLFAAETIIHGFEDNTFKPYDNLTVAQAIKLSACIHAKYYNAELKPYTDSAHWADAYYDYAVKNEIIKEDDFSKIDFDKAITRDRLFYIFANTLPDEEYPEFNEVENAPEQPANEYIRKLFCSGIVIGNEQGFEAEKNIIRADAAELVLRMTAHSRRRIVDPSLQ